MAQAEHPHGARVVRVLEQLRARGTAGQAEAVAAIERERAKLLTDESLLVDGSLREAGPRGPARTVRDACKASKPPVPSLLMYLLVREFKPTRIIELGTNLGISSAYQALALKANGDGQLATFEASPYRQRIARELHTRLGLDNVTYVLGLFQDTLAPWLSQASPVDFAFIDGNHQYEATLAYGDLILAHAKPDAILVFDDIRWSAGMKKAWARLKNDRRFQLVIDLSGIGVCVRTEAYAGRRHAYPRICHALS
jgi:predicted O-methyltransferase YrrM